MASNNNTKAWLGIAVVVVLAGVGWSFLRNSDVHPQSVAQTAEAVPTVDFTKLPTDTSGGQTLSPDIFLDPKAKEAYSVAREIPDVLRQLPCFCGCMQEYGHKNNLFCFMDEHGSACEICEDIALDAGQMHRNGASVKEIHDNIVAKYSKYQPPPVQ